MNLPEGFGPLFRTSPVLELIGPVYSKGEGLDLAIGLCVRSMHCNSRGSVHGGILAMLADVALGYALASSTRPPTSLTTVSLTIDCSGVAIVGQWIETKVDIQKLGTKLAFANCYIHCEDRRITRASGVFAVG